MRIHFSSNTCRRLALAAISLVVLGMASPGWADEQVVTGTGSFTALVTRTTETLEPPCVQLVTRAGQAAFSGLITNTLGDSQFVSQTMSDACADPIQGTFRSGIVLKGATVAGLTGDLVIDAHGVFEGSATLPSGARTRGHGTITGVSGGLKGASGTLQFVGQAISIPGTVSSAFNTYFTEIHLKRGP